MSKKTVKAARMIKSYGLFWDESNVFWGQPKNPGSLLGKPAKQRKKGPFDFREQIAVYVLYDANHKMIYVGQTGGEKKKLFQRLSDHKKDNLSDRWSLFSWFGFRSILGTGELSIEKQAAQANLNVVLNLMEAILIDSAEPSLNKQGGKFGDAKRYIQYRDDERLGKTQNEMIKDIWNDLKNKKK